MLSFKNNLRKLKNYSPSEAICKILNKIALGLKVEFESLRYYFFSTRLSDKKFLSLLDPNYISIKDLLDHIRKRQQPNFFFQLSNKNKIVEMVKYYYPDTIRQAIADADKICEHIFSLLGSEDTYLGKDIDWHTDFKTGFTWKSKFYKKIKYGNLIKTSADIIVPWELSRCQHFVTLGKAYWYTGNEKYAEEFVSEINDWIESNQPMFGVNWVSAMDVAIRAVNWIWGYYFFKDSINLTDDFMLKFLKNLLIHGRYIKNRLVTSKKRHNHYIARLVGLIYIGVLFPEFKESKEWRELGVRELIIEMDRQVSTEGIDYEGSTCYHRLVTELFFSATLLCLNNKQLFKDCSLNSQTSIFPDWYMQKLERMIDFVRYYTNPNGKAPQLGDNDNGRLHILSNYGNWQIFDHTYLLSFGALLFKNQDFRSSIDRLHEEAFWLFGIDSIKNFQAIPKTSNEIHSKGFEDTGIFIMRSRNTHILIDCISGNSQVLMGHVHNSRLSFELFTSGKNIIIDPGTYIYTTDLVWRNKFRSTAYHNTLMVDNYEQNAFHPYSPFAFKTIAKVKVNYWETTELFDFLDAEHDGYKHVSVTHRRQFFFDKENDIFAIRDLLSGSGSHKIEVFFHVNNDIKPYPCVEIPKAVLFDVSETKLVLVPFPLEVLDVSIEHSWVSHSYGIKSPGNMIRYFSTMQIPFEFMFLIFQLSNNEIIHQKLEHIKDYIFTRLLQYT